MQTLSYGYLLPTNPDTGDSFFPALVADIQQLNDHDHDGENSAPLSRQSVSILAANWVAVDGFNGLYKQLITLPGTLEYDDVDLWFRLSTGEFVYPSVERTSNTTFTLYTNDNSLAYVAYCR